MDSSSKEIKHLRNALQKIVEVNVHPDHELEAINEVQEIASIALWLYETSELSDPEKGILRNSELTSKYRLPNVPETSLLVDKGLAYVSIHNEALLTEKGIEFKRLIDEFDI